MATIKKTRKAKVSQRRLDDPKEIEAGTTGAKRKVKVNAPTIQEAADKALANKVPSEVEVKTASFDRAGQKIEGIAESPAQKIEEESLESVIGNVFDKDTIPSEVDLAPQMEQEGQTLEEQPKPKVKLRRKKKKG